jgi:hypothetical protein
MQRDTAGQQAAPADDFETALQALLDQYRNWEDKTQVAKLLDLYSDVVERDETWTTATGVSRHDRVGRGPQWRAGV